MLDILICSLKSRQRQLNELLRWLTPQLGRDAGIDVELDDGTMSIGAKRNLLLQRAKRQYVAFVDDDDMVASNYVSAICDVIKWYHKQNGESPDCVGIVGQIHGGDKDNWTFRHSITVDRWCKDKQNHVFFRTPNHLNPIRTDIAKKVAFPETDWGEDRAYSDMIRPLLETEVFVEHPIYFYKMGNK